MALMIIFRSKRIKTDLEPSKIKYTGKAVVSNLVSWIVNNIFGLAGIRTDNVEEFQRPLIIVYYDIDFLSKPMPTHFWRNRVIKVAQKLSYGEVALSNASDFEEELNDYGLKFYHKKPVVAARDELNQKFAIRDDFTTERLEDFAEKLVAGQLFFSTERVLFAGRESTTKDPTITLNSVDEV